MNFIPYGAFEQEKKGRQEKEEKNKQFKGDAIVECSLVYDTKGKNYHSSGKFVLATKIFIQSRYF